MTSNARPQRRRDAQTKPTRLPEISSVQWRFHTRNADVGTRLPETHELFLWRIPSEWRLVSAMSIGQWLSKAERSRVKTWPSAALGRRFAFARASLRLILSIMFGCNPEDVAISDLGNGRVEIENAPDGRAIAVDIAEIRTWTVIALSAESVGLGFAMLTVDATSSPAATSRYGLKGDEAEALSRARTMSAERARQRTRTLTLSTGGGSAPSSYWTNIDFLMPGNIAACVTATREVRLVRAFGWMQRSLSKRSSGSFSNTLI